VTREPSYRQLMRPLCRARIPLVTRKLDGTATKADLRKLKAIGKALDALEDAESRLPNGRRPMDEMLRRSRKLARDIDALNNSLGRKGLLP
jgi:hypothetical protein